MSPYLTKEAEDLAAKVELLRKCSCVDCAATHGDQAPDPLELEVDRLRVELSKMTADRNGMRNQREQFRAEVVRLDRIAMNAVSTQEDTAIANSELEAELMALKEANAALRAERDLLLADPVNRLNAYRELGAKCAALESERDDARAKVSRLKAIADRLRDKAVFYLDRSRPFSADGQADSLIWADLQRELVIIRRGGG